MKQTGDTTIVMQPLQPIQPQVAREDSIPVATPAAENNAIADTNLQALPARRDTSFKQTQSTATASQPRKNLENQQTAIKAKPEQIEQKINVPPVSDTFYFSLSHYFQPHKTYYPGQDKLQQLTSQNSISSGFLGEPLPKDRLAPDWLFIFLMVCTMLVLVARTFYSRISAFYYKNIATYQLSLKIYGDPSVVKKQLNFLLNLNFLVVGTIILYLLFSRYNINYIEGLNLHLALKLFAALVTIPLGQYMLLKLLSIIIGNQGFDEYLFHTLAMYKIFGIVALPIAFAYAYVENISPIIWHILLISSFLFLWLLRVIRGYKILSKNDVFIYYRILYFCTLEILPVTILLKVSFDTVIS